MTIKSVLLYVDFLDKFIYYIFIILLKLILQSRVLFGGDFIYFNFLLVYVLNIPHRFIDIHYAYLFICTMSIEMR